MPTRWRPGDVVAWRSVSPAHIGYVLPAILLSHDRDAIAVFQPHGTVCKTPTGQRGGPSGRCLVTWDGGHSDRIWTGGDMVRLHVAGTGYSVIRAWDTTQRRFHSWYVNLEAPWRPTPIGFDSLDYVLDITVADDLSGWAWKDQDDYIWARHTGRISDADGDMVETAANQAIEALITRSWPFGADWTRWQPDTNSAVPTLPGTWNHRW